MPFFLFPFHLAVHNALAALRIGAHHRAVAETATNASSSRSHCLLTLHIEAREEKAPGLAVMRRAKFTMVDLAGGLCCERACMRASSTWYVVCGLKAACVINRHVHDKDANSRC